MNPEFTHELFASLVRKLHLSPQVCLHVQRLRVPHARARSQPPDSVVFRAYTTYSQKEHSVLALLARLNRTSASTAHRAGPSQLQGAERPLIDQGNVAERFAKEVGPLFHWPLRAVPAAAPMEEDDGAGGAGAQDAEPAVPRLE